MVREFLILVSVMMLLVGSLVVHYAMYDTTKQDSEISRIVQVTKLPSPSLSVAFYEPRVFLLEKAHNPAYPQMQVINKMDLVYAK